MESACFYIHWLLSCGLLETWVGDCHLGFWKGGDPDSRLKDAQRHDRLCSQRSESLRAFIRSILDIVWCVGILKPVLGTTKLYRPRTQYNCPIPRYLTILWGPTPALCYYSAGFVHAEMEVCEVLRKRTAR